MVRFTLRQCAYFRAVAEHGGIAQAARVLSISQPSVAQAIAKLEDITGLTLFERHHARGLTLTMQGRLFLEQIKALEAQADQTAKQARSLALETAGEVRLGAFWTLAPFFLPRLISGFAREMPDVTIHQQELGLAGLGDALRAGDIDMALTYDRGGSLEGLATTELAALQPRVILSADHPLAVRDSVTPANLVGLPYVMFDGPGSRAYFEEVLAEAGLSPEIAFRSTSLETVRSAVAAGLGFTFLIMTPPGTATYDGGAVRALRLTPPLKPRHIVLAVRKGNQRGVSQQFSDFVGAHFARWRADTGL